MMDITVYFKDGKLGYTYTLDNGSKVLDLKRAIAKDNRTPLHDQSVEKFFIAGYPYSPGSSVLNDNTQLEEEKEYYAAQQ